MNKKVSQPFTKTSQLLLKDPVVAAQYLQDVLAVGATVTKGKVVFENGSEEFLGSDFGLTSEYLDAYQKGYEQALKWREPDTLPQENGTEAILWLTTDKGFPDVSAQCFLKQGSWYWMDTHEVIKRKDFILGWLPWPGPPTQ